ncbi:MAG TPA: hypothetical protein VKW08_25170 [Xanthobacteraceae bacterium]|jgi:hypothetical protein|nr:hypothetical protein [Xanthobacteraceae bacterium]
MAPVLKVRIVGACGPSAAGLRNRRRSPTGQGSYRSVDAALELAIIYLDLADGRALVEGIAKFDVAPRERGPFALSGVKRLVEISHP